MTFSLNRFMPMPDFPFSKDVSVRFLPWIIGSLCFLSAVLIFGAVSMQTQLNASRHHMARMLTVHIPANLDVPQQMLIDHVEETLRKDNRVEQTTRVDDAELRKLVAPWLGQGAARNDTLPLPVLIEVELKDDATEVNALVTSLQKIHRNLRVQSYAQWLEDYLGTLRLMQTAAFGLALLLLSIVALVITFSARMSLMLHQPAINLLHSFGATGDYIARQFQWHAAQLTLRGAFPGILLALACFGLFGAMAAGAPEGENLLPDLRFSIWHVVWGSILLVASCWLANRAARRAVLSGLNRPGSYRPLPSNPA
jgi:cell division transport system permease protein